MNNLQVRDLDTILVGLQIDATVEDLTNEGIDLLNSIPQYEDESDSGYDFLRGKLLNDLRDSVYFELSYYSLDRRAKNFVDSVLESYTENWTLNLNAINYGIEYYNFDDFLDYRLSELGEDEEDYRIELGK